jgi:exocyst complex component 2
MYDELSKKQTGANAKRNALNCIDRYKFFFFLPQKMSNNIKRGNYDQVISDYIRVKSLHGSTKSKVRVCPSQDHDD